MFEDYFDDDTISGGWTQSFSTTGSGVEYTLTSSGMDNQTYLRLYSGIGTVGGTSFSGSGVYQTIVGDFDVCVKIGSPTKELTTYNSKYRSGMAVWIDSSNYMAISMNNTSFSFAYKYNYGIGSSAEMFSYSSDIAPYFIRISKVGNVLTPYCSEDKSDEYELTWLSGPPVTMASGDTRVWLISTHKSGDDQIHTDFDYFITVS
jgi:hypothetical protein